MNKQSFITILLSVLMSMTGAKASAHDISVKNSDEVTIYSFGLITIQSWLSAIKEGLALPIPMNIQAT